MDNIDKLKKVLDLHTNAEQLKSILETCKSKSYSVKLETPIGTRNIDPHIADGILEITIRLLKEIPIIIEGGRY